MSKLLLLMLLVLFIVAISRLVSDGAWLEAASLIVGLVTERDHIRSLWNEVTDE